MMKTRRSIITLRLLAVSLSLLIVGGLAGCNLTRQNQIQPPSVEKGAAPTQAVAKPGGAPGQAGPSNPGPAPTQAPAVVAPGGAAITQPAGAPSLEPTTPDDAALDQDLQDLQNLNNSADNLDDQP